jgi:hypothetical protein
VGESVAIAVNCFIVPRRIERDSEENALSICLDEGSARALATLIPLLGCGEEAAALAFDGLAENQADDFAANALEQIALEERVHDYLMHQLQSCLPEVPQRTAMMRAARRFHVELGLGDPGLHLARIAALDSAVCLILSRLIRDGTPIRSDPAVYGILRRIRDDEARHVRVSRTVALATGNRRVMKNAAMAARDALASILTLAEDAFEALKVDPAALERDIRRLPDGLFTA